MKSKSSILENIRVAEKIITPVLTSNVSPSTIKMLHEGKMICDWKIRCCLRGG